MTAKDFHHIIPSILLMVSEGWGGGPFSVEIPNNEYRNLCMTNLTHIKYFIEKCFILFLSLLLRISPTVPI
jgi:hypothetical protein